MSPRDVMLTCSNWESINMGDIIQTMMLQYKSLEKVLASQVETETSRKRRLKETEVSLVLDHLLLFNLCML